ncbi:putative F-box/kelch-repeat protein [Cardamine amara subsp. amara]|uniref:F-box/kelch-repeat protein n=1 Tax=Cardamine amara subsp. amara TaxID=228776 RepID=A0ABD1BDQ2_CARAN
MKVRIGTAWGEAPRMTVPRARAMNAPAVVLNEKIYVMTGCKEDESTNWAEVFNTKTQIWEPLQDPGTELRSCLIKGVRARQGKLNVKVCDKEHMMKRYVYDPEQRRWDKFTLLRQRVRVRWIDNVRYSCNHKYCYWYDSELVEWRKVMGLDLLHGYVMAEITRHAGKLLIFFWDRFGQSDPNKKLWCALVAPERSHSGEVWGHIEWTDVVRTVPQTSTFVRCVVERV